MGEFSDWVKMVGHLAWPATVLALCFLARKQIRSVVEAIASRIGDPSSHVKIDRSGIEIKTLEEANPSLASIAAEQPAGRNTITAADSAEATSFANERTVIYNKSRRICLVHVLEPTTRRNQAYDLFIYLVPHKGGDLASVRRAEFFFGKYWGNRVFEGKHVGDVIGVRTAAYGPFLCTCRITFSDNEQVTVSRYIDFEMAKLVSTDAD